MSYPDPFREDKEGGRFIGEDSGQQWPVPPQWGGGWLFFDIELAHASAQCTSIKTKDFSRTVLAAYFPFRLRQYPKDVLYLDRLAGGHMLSQ